MVKIIDDIIVVFLMEFSYKDENLEDEFKNLLDKLNKVYNIDIKGSYKINLYKDKIYGAVLEIIKDNASITRKELSRLLDLSEATIKRKLSNLKQHNVIER